MNSNIEERERNTNEERNSGKKSSVSFLKFEVARWDGVPPRIYLVLEALQRKAFRSMRQRP